MLQEVQQNSIQIEALMDPLHVRLQYRCSETLCGFDATSVYRLHFAQVELLEKACLSATQHINLRLQAPVGCQRHGCTSEL